MNNFEKFIKSLTVEKVVELWSRCNTVEGCECCPARKLCCDDGKTCEQTLREWANKECEDE